MQTIFPKLSRVWWTPLAFVIAALVLIFITPIVVERRAAQVRERLANGSEQGRLALNDLEAAFASQLLAGPGHDPTDTSSVATDAHLTADIDSLRAAAEHVDAEAVSMFVDIETRVRQWKAALRNGRRDSTTLAQAREIFATSERLDTHFARHSDAQRAQVRRLQKINIVTVAVLAPIALIAALIVIWSGGRVVRFADAAEERRLEVVRAAEARAALLRGVTHDVKNPLGAAAGYAQLLEEGIAGELPEAQVQMIRRIRRLVDQAVDTVTDLLELARADSGGLPVEYAHTDLAELAREVVEDHGASARERQLALHFSGEPTPLVTDPRRVRQILGNLLSNAIKYTPPNGSVEVAVVQDGMTPNGRRVGVRVADNGHGIPPELRSRVFEEFFRVRPEEGVRGNGLGLAISRRLASLLGGDVTFEPNAERGSVFTLWLTEHRGGDGFSGNASGR